MSANPNPNSPNPNSNPNPNPNPNQVEQLTALCVKSLDDPLQTVRAAAATALGDLSLAALEAPYKVGKKEAGKEPPKPAPSSGGIKLGGFKFGGAS